MTSTTTRPLMDEKILVERAVYKNFWDGFSEKPDLDTMMLNTKADELEVFDRHDILGSLPNYTGMDIADIGAGIGRFTSSFADRGRHVIASDFIESFIMENQKRNARYRNITYKVGDSASLKLPAGSLDLVFTNWMLMYMSDTDVVKFLLNALKWLRADGFLHLRESCSEPSTGRAKSVSMHEKSQNPTHYRLSSVYIELLRSVRFTDENGAEWRFRVEWAHSVPTYIEHQSNWRQIHWLARKMPERNRLALELNSRFAGAFKSNEAKILEFVRGNVVSDNQTDTITKLVTKMSIEWPLEQLLWDTKLDDEHHNWTDPIFKSALNSALVPNTSQIFCYNPRRIGFYAYVNAHMIAETFAYNVWTVETNSSFFRVRLTRANALKDRRVRFAWSESLENALTYSIASNFRGFIATELFAEVRDASNFESIAAILGTDSFLMTLEPVKDNDDKAVEDFIQKIKMLEEHFTLKSVTEVTEIAEESMQNYFQTRKHENVVKPSGLRWMLVEAGL